MKEKGGRKIVVITGCWITNMGSAFLDLGSIESIKQACPEAEIFTASSFPVWLFHSQSKNNVLLRGCFSNYFSLISQLDSEIAIFSGMVLSEGFIERYGTEILNLSRRGVKIIINGGGAGTYSEEEVKKYREFLKEIKPHCFISRDEESFNYYKDLAKHSLNGIDCGFFVSDFFKPTPLLLGRFEVHTFDKIPDPVKSGKDNSVIRTHHSLWKLNRKFFKEANTMMSDRPEDYLNLYANAEVTHSDRVHACVAALAFGRKCRLYLDTPRAQLFEKAGISVKEIGDNIVSLDQNKLTAAKKTQINFLIPVLNE